MRRQSRLGVGLLVMLGGAASGPLSAAGVVTECTQAGLEAAIEGGGDVRFDCTATEIALSSPLVFESVDVRIDGSTEQGAMRLLAAEGVDIPLVLVSTSATVGLSNLQLSGGQAENGGAINNAGTLMLDAVSVSNSRATGNGGGIANTGVMQATGLVLSGNSATQAGGGLFNAGEASVSVSTLSSNEAGAVGGGVANLGTLTSRQVRLAGNRSDSIGGGLYNRGAASLAQASLVDNEAAVAGGGVHSEGRLVLTNTTVARNASGATAAVLIDGADSVGSLLNHVTIVANTLADPTSNAAAGLVINADGAGSVLNSVVADNGVGGQCFLRGTVPAVEGSVSTDNSCTGFAVASSEAIGLTQAIDQVVAGVSQTVYLPELPTVLLDAAASQDCQRDAVAATDQRGQARPTGEGCEVGAVELDALRPVVDLNGAAEGRDTSARYAENDEAVALTPDVVIAGGELTAFTGAAAQLTELTDADAEQLSVDVGASGLTATYQAADGLLELSGTAEPAVYAAVLATLRYRHDGEILGDPARRVRVVAGDDRLLSLPAEVIIRLEPMNDDPVAVDDRYTIAADDVLVVAAPGLLENDSDPDQQDLRAAGPVSSAGGADVVIGADGRLVYDPRRSYAALTAGEVVEDGFSYFAADGAGGRAQARVIVTVTGVNDAPVASDDRFVLSEDGLINAAAPGVLANDSDPDAGDRLTITNPLTVTSGGLPVELSTAGALVFDPRALSEVQALRRGELRTETLRYTVEDSSGLTASAQIQLTIQGVNDPPVAASLGQERLLVDRAAALNLAGAFSDPDLGDALRYAATGLPSSLVLDTTEASVRGTPSASDVGRHIIAVTATDEAGASVSTSLELYIEREGNDPPLVVDPVEDGTLDEGEAWSLDLATVFEDPDGDALVFDAAGLPAGLGVTDATLAGAPSYGTAGGYVVTVTATDPSGASTSTTFGLEITRPAQDLAVRIEPSASVVAPDTPLDWRVTVDNLGAADAGGELRLHIAGVGLSVPETPACTRTVALQAIQLVCSTGAIAAGGQYVVVVVTQADRSGGLWLQAEVGDADTDLAPADNLAGVGVTVAELLAEQPATEFEVTAGTGLAVLDFDGDGQLDVAVGTAAGLPTRLYRRSAASAFEPAGSLGDLGDVRAIVAGNLDAADGQDLVVINAAGGHALYSNDGRGQFVLAPQPIEGGEGLGAVVADMDEDGLDDLLVLNADATPDVYFGEGDDGWFRARLEPASARSLGLSDLDGDGRPEPVFGAVDGDVFQPTIGRRSFGARLSLPTVGVTAWLGGDLDGDGDGDLLAAVPGMYGEQRAAPELRILRSEGGGQVTWGARADYGQTRRLVGGDLDGDGDLDVVSAGEGGVVSLLINDGQGRLRPHATALQANARDLAVRDMDGDGDLDLVLLLIEPEVVQLWFNTGDLVFSDTAGRPAVSAVQADSGSGAWPLIPLMLLLLAALRRRLPN